jgi:acyl-CoA reductase-like NAD-dependent aldehyde dehydrogenase
VAEHAGLHPDRTGLNGSGSRIEVRGPADGALLGTVPNLSPAAVAALLSRARAAQAEFVSRLRAGMVTVNYVLYHGVVAGLPFGGRGNSGYGRVHGEEGMRERFPFRRFGLARAHGLIGFLHGRGPFARARAALSLLRNRS